MHGDGLADCSAALRSSLFNETSRVSRRSSPSGGLMRRVDDKNGRGGGCGEDLQGCGDALVGGKTEINFDF